MAERKKKSPYIYGNTARSLQEELKQSELTAKIAQVSKMEKELNTMKLSNDEAYAQIQSNINLEEIRRIAIEELGMSYAEEGQIILYQGNKKDYMHQNAEE